MSSKKPYDFLFTDKQPFLLVEHCILAIKDGSVVAISKDNGVETLPVATICVVVLGNGTSITSDAVIKIGAEGAHLAFGKGGLNIHSHFIGNRWYPTEPLIRQMSHFLDPMKRLAVAREFFLERQRQSKDFYLIDKAQTAGTHAQLLGIEGAWSKRNYGIIAKDAGIDFKRDNQSIIGENGRISLLNNLMYHYITSLLLSIGYNPSIGFIHGQKRRGGLAFDVADIFKHEFCVRPAMRDRDCSAAELMRELSNKLLTERSVFAKDLIDYLKRTLC